MGGYSMDPAGVAGWLANADGNGASDEEFAECMVLLDKFRRNRPMAINGAADMEAIDTAGFSEWVKSCLDGIIRGEEECQYAWWKQARGKN